MTFHNVLSFLFALVVFVGWADAQTKKASSNWCEVEYPAMVVPGDTIEVKVTPRDIPDGMKLAVDLHWSGKDGTGGGFLSFAERQDAVNGKSRFFHFQIKPKDNLGTIRPVVFLTPDGSFDKRTQTFSVPGIPVGSKQEQQAAASAVTQTKKASSNWCEVEYPAVVVPGDTIEVKVTPRDIPDGMKLAVDLHWSGKDGTGGGFLSFAERQDAVNGKSRFFHFQIKPKDNLGAICPVVFLTPDGSFDKRKQTFAVPGIPVGSKQQGPTTAAAAAQEPKVERPASVTFKKSWIWVQPVGREVTEHDSFDVTVEYYLDPTDTWGKGTTLSITPLGPWIDNPDGKYSSSRTHISYYGLWPQTAGIKAGRGTHTFTMRTDKLFPFNSLHFLVSFKDADGNSWPWDVRGGGVKLTPSQKFYTLGTAEPGNLFTYDQQPKVQIRFVEGAAKGERKTLRYTLVSAQGQETKGEFAFVSGASGETIDFPLNLAKRGVTLVEAEVEGWGRREMVLGWIPKVAQSLDGKRTPFGVTNVGSPGESRVAQRLGFSWVRHFTSWNGLQPAPDVWKLEGMDRVLRNNRESGLTPWLLLIGPPPWVQTDKPRNVGYAPYGFDPAALAQSIRVMSERWKGQIWGWEWQNEIVPGSEVADPVANYLEFCRIATEAAKGCDPKMQTQMAGGLWPRNFRADLLKRGLARYVDVIPVHYSNLDGIRNAQEDMATAGVSNARIWDNETARGLSVWKMPMREMLQSKLQSQWVLERWPEMLAAGAEQVTYFGGAVDPCGNWSYLLDETTPRPVAATLAVLIAKLGHAEPVGKFYHSGGVFCLFARDGKAVLVASPGSQKTINGLRVGTEQVVVTDYQGNESALSTAGGKMNLALDDMPVFVDGADLETLKSYLVLTVGTSNRPQESVQLTAVQGESLVVPMQVRNVYSTPTSAEISLWPAGAAEAAGRLTLTLTPGEQKVVQVPVLTSGGAGQRWNARLEFGQKRLPTVEMPFQVSWVNPSMLGNLLRNGGFETAGADQAKPANWGVTSGVQRISSDGLLGTGTSILRYGGGSNWISASQTISCQGGQSLLYTVWAHTQNTRQCGSNVTYVMANGKTKELYIPNVFQMPSSSASWQLMAFRAVVPEGTTQVNFTPVGQVGSGWMLLDNARVTPYEGSNFATEASRAVAAPKIDGDLSDWKGQEAIPLLGGNQLTKFVPSYAWTPANLSGVAYLQWDEKALYLAVEVIDDQAVTPQTGDRTPESDSVTLAIQPTRLGSQANNKAFAYYLSAASPGGGSGRYTLYRPPAHSGGLAAGQLAKDSSAYELAIRRTGNRTIYEARFPWSELGGIQPRLGTKLGLSLRLDDNDGSGRAAAMTWGDGLEPAWEPSAFGVLTLIN